MSTETTSNNIFRWPKLNRSSCFYCFKEILKKQNFQVDLPFRFMRELTAFRGEDLRLFYKASLSLKRIFSLTARKIEKYLLGKRFERFSLNKLRKNEQMDSLNISV